MTVHGALQPPHAPERLALGIDLGTGSARAFVYDAAGRPIAGARRPYRWRLTADGGVETDADELLRLFGDAVDGALRAGHDATRAPIVAVGISALWHTLLGIDAAGRPVSPVYAWNDTRATGAARQLRARLEGAGVHARTGATLHPAYLPARLMWIRTAAPAAFHAARWWVSMPEYAWLRLTGQLTVGVSIAAGSGLLDQRTLTWDAELLDAVGIGPDRLAPLARDAAEPAAPTPETAARWPALRDARWLLPAGDGLCACIGSGCTGPDRIALTVGTSAAVRVLRPWPAGTAVPAGLWMYRLDRERALFGAASSNGGSVRDWLLRTLKLPAAPALDALLAARPAAGHGITFLPFLSGERSPDWPLDATAVIAGLRLGHEPIDMLQAGMEAVAYRVSQMTAQLRGAVPEARTIVGSGTALERSAYWTQLVADALGETVHLSAEPEASSRGAALLALVAAGELGSTDDAPRPATAAFHPVAERHALHRDAMARLRVLESNREA